MKKLFCTYCGQLLEENCNCEREAFEEHEALIDALEERQHASGFYAFQDTMDNFRNER